MGKKSSKIRKSSKYSGDDDNKAQTNTMRRFAPVHSDNVTCVTAHSPGVCVSGSSDKSVVQYNWMEGKVQQRWVGHEQEVTKVVYSPTLNMVLSGSRDKTVNIWKCGTPANTPIQRLQCHKLVVTGIALDTERNHVCTGSRDNYIKVWDIEKGICMSEAQQPRNLITHLTKVPNQSLVAQTSEDRTLRLWDLNNLEEIAKFPRKSYIQMFCDVSTDGNYCISCSNGFGGEGCETTLWDLRQRKLVCEYRGHIQTTTCCMFVADTGQRHLLATCSHDCSVKLWDRDSQECLNTSAIDSSGPITSIAAYENGHLCCSTFNAGVQVLQVLPSSQLVRKVQY